MMTKVHKNVSEHTHARLALNGGRHSFLLFYKILFSWRRVTDSLLWQNQTRSETKLRAISGVRGKYCLSFGTDFGFRKKWGGGGVHVVFISKSCQMKLCLVTGKGAEPISPESETTSANFGLCWLWTSKNDCSLQERKMPLPNQLICRYTRFTIRARNALCFRLKIHQTRPSQRLYNQD